MSIAWKLSLSVVAAFAIAARSLRVILVGRKDNDSIHNGPWRTSEVVATAGHGLVGRARTVRRGPLAMRAEEAVYFGAEEDQSGAPLRSSATYLIEGRDPDARWWSMTVYRGGDLIGNILGRYSISKTTVRRNPDGGWTIRLSSTEQSENWLPACRGDKELIVLFRCYNPSEALVSSLGTVPLPRITRV